MLFHREDYRQVVFVLIAFGAQLSVYLFHEALSALTLLAISLCLFFPYSIVLSIAHNHYHRAIFRSNRLNCVLNYILFLTGGTSPYSWTLQHNLGHHLHYMDQENDPTPWLVKGKIVSRIRFTLYGTLNIYPYCFRIGRSYPKVFKRFLFHFWISLLLLAALCILDPRGFLYAVMIPTGITMFNLIDINYDHHTGMSLEDEYSASYTDDSPVANWFLFNVGYHLAHHLKPNLHWSKLADYHASMDQATSRT